MDSDIKKLLKIYESKARQFGSLRESIDGELLHKLKLFDLRLRLALDMQLSFNGEIALAKSEKVHKTYAALLKLVELWNASEALLRFAKAANKGYAKEKSAYLSYLQILTKFSDQETQALKSALNKLKEKHKEKKFRADFERFIEKVSAAKGDEEGAKKETTLQKDCKNAAKHLADSSQEATGKELIAWIYAMRNMYYHEAEAAKMGMDYSSAQYFLEVLTEAFAQHLLLLAASILEREYKARENGAGS